MGLVLGIFCTLILIMALAQVTLVFIEKHGSLSSQKKKNPL